MMELECRLGPGTKQDNMEKSWFITAIEKAASQCRLAEESEPGQQNDRHMFSVLFYLLYEAFKAEQCGMQGLTPNEIRSCVQRARELMTELGFEARDEDKVAVLKHNMCVMLSNSDAESVATIGEALGCSHEVWARGFDELWEWYEEDCNVLSWVVDDYDTPEEAANAVLEASNRVRALVGLPLIEQSDPRFVRIANFLRSKDCWLLGAPSL